MVREDIVRGLNVLYKMCKKEDRTQEELEMNIYVWEEIFKEYSYEQFKLAIMQFLANDVYKTFPAVGAVYKYITMANKKKHREFTEIWSEIYKAICNSGYNSQEMFDKLSIEAKEVVRNPQNLRQWAMTEDFNAEVVYSNLNQIYKNNCNHKDKIENIPNNLRIGVGFEEERNFIEKKDYYYISDNFDEEPIRTTDFLKVNNMIDDLKRKIHN
jgi:Loader and inhibitor of phage G40P